jgi:hypothetical protein
MPLLFDEKFFYLAKNFYPMKKFIVFLLFFLFVGTVGCRVQHFLIVGLGLHPIEFFTEYDNERSYRKISEFEYEIVFLVSYEREYMYLSESFNLQSQCYATSLGHADDNHVIRESFSLTLDKEFSYAGEIIGAGVDLLQYPAIAKEASFTEPPHNKTLGIVIEFSDAFVQNATFDSEPYTVTFSCRTSDDLLLQADATVKFPAE